jgi:hypothetical protein
MAIKVKYKIQPPDDNVTHTVTAINVDNFKNTVHVNIQKGTKVDSYEITMEHAQEIGFMNMQALDRYCK